MMPTMQQIDQIERALLALVVSEIARDEIPKLCAAARRGVEADAEIAQLRRVIERGRDSTRTELLLSEQLSEQRAGNIKLLERAEKAEAELAALKAAQPQETDHEGRPMTYWGGKGEQRRQLGEPTQPERVSVPREPTPQMMEKGAYMCNSTYASSTDAARAIYRALLAAAQEGK